MKIYEIGTGYTSIPAKIGAATEIVVEELAKSLAKMKYNIQLIDIKDENRKNTELSVVEIGMPHYFLKTDVKLGIFHKAKRIIYSVSLAKMLKRILKETNENTVLHFHNQYNMYFFLKLVPEKYRKNCVMLYTNHSYIWHDEWKNIKKTVKKRYFQEIYSMKNADYVFVLNENAFKTIVNNVGVSKEKIRMIDNGVNKNIYKPLTTEDKQSIKNALQLKNKKVFIQIGSVCERKNQLEAIRLLQPFMQKDKDIVFVYAGGIISCEYQAEIEQYVQTNNLSEQVKYVGEVAPGTTLNNYYNIAEAMIFPSNSEGFSLVILEAMSAGVPVIVNEKLQFKLADACLKFSTSDQFSEIIQKQILDTESQNILSKKVRRIVENQYSWDVIANNYMKNL